MNAPAAHMHAAILAVVQHAIDHQLPVPFSYRPTPNGIDVALPRHAYAAWTATLNITRESSEPATRDITALLGPSLRWEAAATLPDTGVRVIVSGHMLANRPKAVGA